MGSHLSVNWTSVPVPELDDDARARVKAYQQLADSIPESQKGGLPSLIFVFSDEMKSSRASSVSARLTSQAKDSAAAWVTLFQTEGDYSVVIPGRFFNVFRAEAARVSPAHNKYVCSEKAPIVILTRANGEVASYFEGRAKIKRRSVVEAMGKTLQKDDVVKNMRPFGRLHELMKSLERIETARLKDARKLRELEVKLNIAKARDAKRARRSDKELDPSMSTVRARENIDDFKNSRLLPKLMTRSEILKEEYALLEALDLPSSKMPPRPKDPQPAKAQSTSSQRRSR